MNIADLRFLVVEDHGFQRWVTGNLLERLGATQVFSASDGNAALELLAGLDDPVDIIISDLDMPGMDGMEFIRHIGQTWGMVSLIVASSLNRSLITSVEAMAREYGVRFIGAIEKPATARKLEAVIALHEPPLVEPMDVPAAAATAEEIANGLRRGQFEAFFQPKVEVQTRRMVGAEAMARWRHPEKGIVAPADFIHLLEESGSIDQLTQVMLTAAVFNCGLWRSAGVDASVSVNLSLASAVDMTLADRMLAIVTSRHLEPRHVTFELTESLKATHLGNALENLSRLRMKGFGLSIDDYGTGHSSMERLVRVPFTELKIDQKFVRNALLDASSRAALESSLELAGKLRLVAVAEGVETQAQWDLLRELNCPLAQGYFIAKPMPAGEFLEWVRLHHQASP